METLSIPEEHAIAEPSDRSAGGLRWAASDQLNAGAAKPERMRTWVVVVNLLATIQFVWFYVSQIPSEIDLPKYEHGLAPTPFQYRLLLMFPLRWAHQSRLLTHLAQAADPIWFSRVARPEDLIQIVIDVACVIITGTMATKLYTASSRSRMLAPLMYPLTLVMCGCTYSMLILHQFRYIYDLPSLAFFAVGIYIIYRRKHPALFAGLFVVATLNRETTLFLLLYYVIAECLEGPRFLPKNMLRFRTVAVVAPLAAFWIAWHLWVSAHYAFNPTAAEPRIASNLLLLVCGIEWPQLLAACGYLIPFVFISRKLIVDPLLRAWLWILPPWFCFMLYYGILMEIRLFGELIPYVACVSALILEEQLIAKFRSAEFSHSRGLATHQG